MIQEAKPAKWTPELIRRFWNYTSQRKGIEAEYFSFQVGEALVNFLRRANVLKPNGDVLDFGCGPGYLLHRFLDEGLWCYGFDFSDESVRSVNERFNGLNNWKGAVSATTLPAPFSDSAFDVVTCVETLEHLLDDTMCSVLGEITRLLKRDGVALFTTPYNEDIPANSVYCPFCDHTFHPVQHVRSFDETSLRRLLEAQGFQVLFCRHIDLSELQRFRRPGRLTIKGLIRYCLHVTADAIYPVKAADTGYVLPRVSPGRNLCAIVTKRKA